MIKMADDKPCVEGRIDCVYDYGELDDEPCYSCHKGSHFKPRKELEKPKVVVLDNNPLSIAGYLEDHPEIAKEFDEEVEK